MVLDGGVGTATAVGNAVNISLRLFQVIYEFKAVGQQTQDLLDSTKHVSSTLESARSLRQQKSAFLSAEERNWIDNILVDSKRCLDTVAALVEPARVDIQTKSGRVGFVNRSLFVFRDSPKVATNLARLNLAHQSLNAAMAVLCSKGTQWQSMSHQQRWQNTPELHGMSQQELMPPPSYEIDQSLHNRRFLRHGSVSRMTPFRQPQVTPPILLSDDHERFDCTNFQHTTLVAELEDPDTRLTTIDGNDFSVASPVELEAINASIDPRPPVLCEDSQGLPVMELCDKGCQMNQHISMQGYPHYGERINESLPVTKAFTSLDGLSSSAEIPSKAFVDTNCTGPLTQLNSKSLATSTPSRARSRGRAWLESRGLQRP